MPDRICLFSLFSLVSLCGVLALSLVGCPFGNGNSDNIDFTSGASNNANQNAPKPEMPPAAPQGPIGPAVTQALGFVPVPIHGTPAVMPGGKLLLVDPTERSGAHGRMETNRLAEIRINAGDWRPDREAQTYHLPIGQAPFHVVTVPEVTMGVGTNRDNDLFVVMFRKASGHYGSYKMTQREPFSLPEDFDYDATALRGFAVGPLGTSFLMATTTGVHEVTLKPRTAFDPEVTSVLSTPVAAIAGTANCGAFVITTDSVIHHLTATDGALVGVRICARGGCTGEPLAIEVAVLGGEPVIKVRYAAHTGLAGTMMAGHVAFLPGDRLAWLAGEKLVVIKRGAAETVLASIEGMPANASWLGADPDGGAVAILAGDQLTSVLLDLQHDAFTSGE